jgi:hypothetical protein
VKPENVVLRGPDKLRDVYDLGVSPLVDGRMPYPGRLYRVSDDRLWQVVRLDLRVDGYGRPYVEATCVEVEVTEP